MNTKPCIKGRPKELHVLDYGLFKVHANGRVIGICGFLIRTDAGESILVDTGFPRKYAYDIPRSSEEDRLYDFGEVLELTPGNLPEAQLARAGVKPDEIDLLIMTHTHIDHVGGIADFPHCPILMARAERTLDKPLYWGDVRPIDWPDREYLLIDEDTDLSPGFRVLFAPGHAPGQLSLFLELPETGSILLTGDAISRPAEVAEGFEGARDVAQARKSGERLMSIAEEYNAFIIYGHSPEQWPDLRKTPKFYG
ncbi:N-acyl homoserine lactone hydrolase [Salinihabitans flavidus]|uniref:N-acyl homoserine lactone hydrolase n=1 Tax=Salinihabitans flavidus TaxID=569882 RepID=A0A1H8UGM2_9RHOB|nr:N-acyl homoserine lactonase family protein [Salinihabitans flavidus]SEP02331.1 N-acyl homoserine lactone hydrolase [Salinihabitans flavidus]